MVHINAVNKIIVLIPLERGINEIAEQIVEKSGSLRALRVKDLWDKASMIKVYRWAKC